MNRLFGKKKPVATPQGPSLGDIGTKMDGRVTNLEEKVKRETKSTRPRTESNSFSCLLSVDKIAKLDQELAQYKAQMKTKKGAAANSVKQRALQVVQAWGNFLPSSS